MDLNNAVLPNLLQNIQPKSSMNFEIRVEQEDDDVSKLSFGDNMSYICDLAMQKKNRKAMIQQETFEETQELYEIAIQEGAEQSQELFKEIFQLVETELIESYKEKDKLLNQRLQVALQAQTERSNASNAANERGPAQSKVDLIDKKIQKEEIKILKRKIKKYRKMVRDIMKDKHALKNKKKATQLKRLQKKHDHCVEELEKQKKDPDSTTVDTSASLGFVLGAIGKGDESCTNDDQKEKKKKKKKKKKEKDRDKDKESDKIPKAERSSSDKSKSKSKNKDKIRSSDLKSPKRRSKSISVLPPIYESKSTSEKRRSRKSVSPNGRRRGDNAAAKKSTKK